MLCTPNYRSVFCWSSIWNLQKDCTSYLRCWSYCPWFSFIFFFGSYIASKYIFVSCVCTIPLVAFTFYNFCMCRKPNLGLRPYLFNQSWEKDSLVTVERLELLSSLSGRELTSKCATATDSKQVIIGLMMCLEIPHSVTSAGFLNLVQKISILFWGWKLHRSILFNFWGEPYSILTKSWNTRFEKTSYINEYQQLKLGKGLYV